MQKLLKIFFGILLLSSSVFLTECFIVPQEIPSLLSLVYSNIPPIKKGTDSRIGFGYRFGDHADFQVQFEIGPQKETQPIGTASQSKKRNIRPADEFQIERAVRKDKIKQQDSTTKGPSWLSNWFTQLTNSFQPSTTTTRAPKVIKLPAISSSALQQLQRLYQKSGTENEIDYESNSVSIESGESSSSPVVDVATAKISESFSHHLPPVVVAILRENRSQQPHRSKDKIDSITRDLSNVDLD